MSLEPIKTKGFLPGNQEGKKGGRPRDAWKRPLGVKRRVRGKFKIHPVDKLISIAKFIEATNPEFAAKIWIRLLDSCEMEERKQKGASSPSLSADTSPTTEVDENDLLEELEQNGLSTTPSSKDPSVESRPITVFAEAGPEVNLSEYQGK